MTHLQEFSWSLGYIPFMPYADTHSFFYWTDNEDVEATGYALGDAKHTLEASPLFYFMRDIIHVYFYFSLL